MNSHAWTSPEINKFLYRCMLALKKDVTRCDSFLCLLHSLQQVHIGLISKAANSWQLHFKGYRARHDYIDECKLLYACGVLPRQRSCRACSGSPGSREGSATSPGAISRQYVSNMTKSQIHGNNVALRHRTVCCLVLVSFANAFYHEFRM